MADLFTSRLNDGTINLTIGSPGLDTLQKTAQLFVLATEHRLEQVSRSQDPRIFQYGLESGYPEYLSNLSEFLTAQYGDTVDAEDLLLTAGATNGLQLVLSSLVAHPAQGGLVFIESPTYFIGLEVITNDLGFEVIGVPMDHDGVDVEALAGLVETEFLRRRKGARVSGEQPDRFWAAFYTMPTFHNPTGITTSQDKCRQLVKLARRFDLLIVCDDVYNLLHYDVPAPPKRLLFYDKVEKCGPDDRACRGCHVISNGSFSKILGPGVRIGWIETGPELRNQLTRCGVLRSGGAVNHAMSAFVASVLQLGLQQEHLTHLQLLYGQRLVAVAALLRQHLGTEQSFTFTVPSGGYFVWITGPDGFRARPFAEFARRRFGVIVMPGDACQTDRLNDTISPRSIRLSIAYYDLESLSKGVQLMCQAVAEFLKLP